MPRNKNNFEFQIHKISSFHNCSIASFVSFLCLFIRHLIAFLGLKKQFTIVLILCTFFIPKECFAEKINKHHIVGLSRSGVKKIWKKLKLKSFQHPAFLTNKILYQTITSLYYSNYMNGLSLWEIKKRAVFQAKEAKKLAPLIRKSFEKATPKQMVYFSIGKRNKKTSGNIFYSNSKLYFYFLKLKGKKQKSSGTERSHDLWKLVPQKGQILLKQKGFIGIVDTYTNWIIVEDTKKKQPIAEKPLLPTDHIKKNNEMETKLSFLKEMLAEGLITKKDYEKKKKELLEGYNQLHDQGL